MKFDDTKNITIELTEEAHLYLLNWIGQKINDHLKSQQLDLVGMEMDKRTRWEKSRTVSIQYCDFIECFVDTIYLSIGDIASFRYTDNPTPYIVIFKRCEMGLKSHYPPDL